MKTPLDPIVHQYQTQLEASRICANILLNSAEKIDHLGLSAMKDAFTEQYKFCQAMTAAKDPQGLASVQTAFMQPNFEKMFDYYRTLFQLLAETNSAIGKAVEEYLGEVNKNVADTLNTVDNAPLSEATPNVIDFWNAAYRQMANMMNQYTQTAQAELAQNHQAAGNKAKRKIVPAS